MLGVGAWPQAAQEELRHQRPAAVRLGTRAAGVRLGTRVAVRQQRPGEVEAHQGRQRAAVVALGEQGASEEHLERPPWQGLRSGQKPQQPLLEWGLVRLLVRPWRLLARS
jgi:hypothetical protein